MYLWTMTCGSVEQVWTGRLAQGRSGKGARTERGGAIHVAEEEIVQGKKEGGILHVAVGVVM